MVTTALTTLDGVTTLTKIDHANPHSKPSTSAQFLFAFSTPALSAPATSPPSFTTIAIEKTNHEPVVRASALALRTRRELDR